MPTKPVPSRPRSASTDVDQAIKELLRSYPVDSLEFLLPEATKEWGKPTAWEFLNTTTRKHDLSNKGYVMDLNIRYTFRKRSVVLVVLIEHWSTAKSVNLHRTAHYYLDLLERFPKDEVVPVALVTDLKPAKIANTLHVESRNRVWLHFETLVREVSRENASAWDHARNAVAQVLRGAMAGPESRVAKSFGGAQALRGIVSADECRRLFPLLAEVGKLTQEEVEEYMKKDELIHSEVVDWLESRGEARGKAIGKAESNLVAARKMQEHGIEWKVITDVTGIRPADLKKIATSKAAKPTVSKK